MSLNVPNLVDALLLDPVAFRAQGKHEDLMERALLTWSSHGELIWPLLTHPDVLVRREITAIVSELGIDAIDCLREVRKLWADRDMLVRFSVLEILIVCARGTRAADSLPLFESLDWNDPVIRGLAMRLLCNADESQVAAAVHAFGEEPIRRKHHLTALAKLRLKVPPSNAQVEEMLNSEEPLDRCYGLVLAGRRGCERPELLTLASNISDPEVADVAAHLLNLLEIEARAKARAHARR